MLPDHEERDSSLPTIDELPELAAEADRLRGELGDVERTTITREPDRDAWLTQRAPYVGASEAAALFGEHPFLELGDLAAEKVDGVRREQTREMLRGIMLEDAVASWWAREHGAEIHEATELYLAGPTGSAPVLCATLDREIHGERAALEVKTTARRISEIERYWYWQAQAQLVCTGYDRIEFAVLDGTMDLASYTVRADPVDQRQLVRRAAAFLEHVRAGRIPPGAHVSRDGIRQLYPDPKVPSVELVPVTDERGRTLDPIRVLRDLKLAKARQKTADHTVSKLEGILRTQLRDAQAGTIDGKVAVTLRVEHYRSVDVTRLRDEEPELAEKYSASLTRRRMLLK